MSTAPSPAVPQREPELLGQIVVVIGGSSGIGLETARRAHAEGAEVILTGRDDGRLEHASREIGARSMAAFDANDPVSLARFFDGLPARIDHVMITAGRPTYAPLLEMQAADVRAAMSDRVVLGLEVARNAAGKMRSGGTLLLMGTTGGRRASPGVAAAATAVLPAFVASLALELAPVRVNLDRRRLRRYAAVGVTTWRRPGSPPRATALDAPDRASRRTGGRRCPRRSSDGQHGDHWRDVRHRRRPAASRVVID